MIVQLNILVETEDFFFFFSKFFDYVYMHVLLGNSLMSTFE